MAGLIKRTPAVAPPAANLPTGEFDPDAFLGADEFDPDKFLGTPVEPQGELPAGARAGLSFMSSGDDRKKYLSQKFPGIKFGKWKDEEVVFMPGEKSPRYVDDPSLTMRDVADFAGDLPGMAGGLIGAAVGGPASMLAAGAGAAGGEVIRKGIGRKFFLGEDAIQPEKLGQDALDVSINGVVGGLTQGLGNAATGFLARRAETAALQGMGNAGKKTLATTVAAGAGEPGQIATAAASSAAGRQESKILAGNLEGRIEQEANPIDSAINETLPPPKSMAELTARHEANIAKGAVPDLPSADRLREIETTLPDLEYKPTNVHYAMLKNKQSYDILRVRLRDLPGKEREAVDAYDQAMKREIEGKIDKMIGGLGTRPKMQKTEAGHQLVAEVSEIYEANKARVKPMFESIQAVPIDEGQHVSNLANRLAEEVPGLGEALSLDEAGKLVLKPFRPDMALSRKGYAEMSEILGSLNEGQLSFKGMQRIREYLRKQIDPRMPGESQDLQHIRKAMLSHMEDLVESKAPDANVRGTFKEWAKNERMLEDFETMLGGKIESFNALYNANPDAVLSKLFSSPNTVAKTRELLGEERFANFAGDFLNDLRGKATDSAKAQMSMARFASELKQRRGVLEAAFGKEQYKRLVALADLGKIIPDMPPVNPSGTGKTSLIGTVLRGAQKLTGGVSGALTGLGDVEGAATALDAAKTSKEAIDLMNRILADQPPKLRDRARSKVAEALLPLVKSQTARAFLKTQLGGGTSRLMGPNQGLVGRPDLEGPGQ